MDYPDFSGKGEKPCASPEVNPDIFFPEPEDLDTDRRVSPGIAQAKTICGTCPYKTERLVWALKNNEPGIWGGTTDRERKRIKRQGRQALKVVRTT